MRVSNSPKVVVGIIAAVILVMLTSGCNGVSDVRMQQQLPISSASTAASAVLPSSSTSQAQPGSSTSASPTSSSAPKVELVKAPANTSATFTIQFHTRQVGSIPRGAPEKVGELEVASGEVVNPPEPEGVNWSNTSVRVKSTPYPQLPAVGTTVVGGHACMHHACPFTAIKQNRNGSFTVAKKDTVVVRTPNGVLTYRVCNIGRSPKTAAYLVIPSCGSVPIDLVVGTCHYEHGDTSNLNIVIAATLIGGTRL